MSHIKKIFFNCKKLLDLDYLSKNVCKRVKELASTPGLKTLKRFRERVKKKFVTTIHRVNRDNKKFK